jgi:hypothetical protein
MSEAKHTPGPWIDFPAPVINSVPMRFGDCIIGQQVWAATTRICLVEEQNVGPEQELANARLIAAAPDLLAALKEAVAHYRSYNLGEYIPVIEALIAKAEGHP